MSEENQAVTEYPTRAAWLAARQIGSSDAAAILGVHEQRGAFGVWARLVDGVNVEDEAESSPADLVNDPRHWGHVFENPIAQHGYALLHPERTITDPGEFTLYRHPKHPYITASPDLLVECPRKGRGVMEVKYYSPYDSHNWETWPPLWVQLQLQHHLLVTGDTWGSICVLLGSTLKSWDIDAHPVVHRAMLSAYAKFQRCVETRTPPTLDGLESTARAIAEYYRPMDETTVLLTEEFAELDRIAQALSDAIRVAEKERTQIRNTIRAEIGVHRCGIIEGTNIKYRIGSGSESQYLRVAPEHALALTAAGIEYETKTTTRHGAMTRSGGPKHKQIAASETPKEIANA